MSKPEFDLTGRTIHFEVCPCTEGYPDDACICGSLYVALMEQPPTGTAAAMACMSEHLSRMTPQEVQLLYYRETILGGRQPDEGSDKQ